MLHIFRKNATRDAAPIERDHGSIVVSHILTRFLKRLRQHEKPRLLDLGRLSGSNIEFFARHGCKVQVEDLLLAIETEPSPAPVSASEPGASPGVAAPEDGEAPCAMVLASDAPSSEPQASGADSGSTRSPGPLVASSEVRRPGVVPLDAGGAHRPGARPSRRIILPPRTFASPVPPLGRTAQAQRPGFGAGAAATRNALLPTRFAYADETFDALVAWDIFNYFEPGTMTLLAAEARRILKPGGLLLGFFHARRPEGPETARRYSIVDETRVSCDGKYGPPLRRYVYQNRDIEKMFTGLSIVEAYFLKNATRELLMEKKSERFRTRPLVRPAAPKPRFIIE